MKQRLHAGAGIGVVVPINVFATLPVRTGILYVVGQKQTGHVISARRIGIGSAGTVEIKSRCAVAVALEVEE